MGLSHLPSTQDSNITSFLVVLYTLPRLEVPYAYHTKPLSLEGSHALSSLLLRLIAGS